MADFEHRDNSGSLFVNERKTRENHPDRTGSASMICPHCEVSTKYRVSGWVKEGRGGKQNWLSVAFTPEEAGERPAGAARNTGERPVAVAKEQRPVPTKDTPGYSDLDEDVPF